MLAVVCETAARNELTEQEAVRVLLEAIELPDATARELLEELSRSILIRTPTGISLQMRSYGEYLAAEELHDKGIDRLPFPPGRDVCQFRAVVECGSPVRAYSPQSQ